jgi:hypothetical protein
MMLALEAFGSRPARLRMGSLADIRQDESLASPPTNRGTQNDYDL